MFLIYVFGTNKKIYSVHKETFSLITRATAKMYISNLQDTKPGMSAIRRPNAIYHRTLQRHHAMLISVSKKRVLVPTEQQKKLASFKKGTQYVRRQVYSLVAIAPQLVVNTSSRVRKVLIRCLPCLLEPKLSYELDMKFIVKSFYIYQCDTSQKYQSVVPHESSAFFFCLPEVLCIVSTILPFCVISRICCKMTPE